MPDRRVRTFALLGGYSLYAGLNVMLWHRCKRMMLSITATRAPLTSSCMLCCRVGAARLTCGSRHRRSAAPSHRHSAAQQHQAVRSSEQQGSRRLRPRPRRPSSSSPPRLLRQRGSGQAVAQAGQLSSQAGLVVQRGRLRQQRPTGLMLRRQQRQPAHLPPSHTGRLSAGQMLLTSRRQHLRPQSERHQQQQQQRASRAAARAAPGVTVSLPPRRHPLLLCPSLRHHHRHRSL